MGATQSTDEGAVLVPKAAVNMQYNLKQAVQVEMSVDMDQVIAVAQQAGDAIMAIYHGDSDKWDVDHKADDSPLTRADTEANRIICDALAAHAPHIPIISEENKVLPHSTRKNYQYAWVVDPLDGTKEFIKRVPHFTVNIALLKGDSPVLGVVHTPAAKTVHFAAVGQGAFVRSPGKDDKRIQCAEFVDKSEGLVMVGSSSHMSDATRDFLAMYPNNSLQQVGSSLKFLLVAEGLAHVYPRLAPTCEWDTAAAHIVVTEAGGEVLQAGLCDNKGKALEDWQPALSKQEKVVYNKPDILNPYFVVYGKRKPAVAPVVTPAEL